MQDCNLQTKKCEKEYFDKANMLLIYINPNIQKKTDNKQKLNGVALLVADPTPANPTTL